MLILSSFPLHLAKLHQYIASVLFPSLPEDEQPNGAYAMDLRELPGWELSEDEVSNEFAVRLKDGRAYWFAAYTPEMVRQIMHESSERCFIQKGIVLVHAITIEAILDAIQECLSYEECGDAVLDHFGVRDEGAIDQLTAMR